MRLVRHVLRHWLPLAVVTTAMCGLVYAAVQQALRQGANDPQIQMAEDAAEALRQGAVAESLLPPHIDVGKSLAPFVIVYDDTGQVVASSGLLHGKVPSLPAGVLEYTRRRGQDRVTWQPENGVRVAAVVARFQGATPGFVLAGRSLREVEKRETQTELMAGAAWVATLAALLVVVVACEFILKDVLILGDRRRRKEAL